MGIEYLKIHSVDVPEDKIPYDWCTNRTDYPRTSEWTECFGGRRWYFNAVLHIPFIPRLVLVTRNSEGGTLRDCELVEVDGGFFLLRFDGERYPKSTSLIVGGNHELSLDEVLTALRTGSPLELKVWRLVDPYAISMKEYWEEDNERLKGHRSD